MDKYLADKLTSGLTLPAIISALVAGLGAAGPAAVILTAVAAILIVEINVCKKPAGDVTLYIVGAPGAYTVVCNPF
jgi:hypothetical protein